jgi:site-specific DNA-methyltransferase (adenine-specific)
MLLKGDCLETLKSLPDNSVDSIVTDPPYGLEFMGKDWDAPWRNAEVVSVTDKKTNGVFHDKGFTSGVRYNKGHKEMLAFQEWFTEIAKECLRVLKPGGHFLAFGGTRTYHRLACAIEDAGFEIRDSIHWTYGSGFPKSLNIGKAIDKAGSEGGWENNAYGGGNSKCEICGKWKISGSPCKCPKDKIEYKTPEAQQWNGWGTALKPSHEPVVVARKPIIGTVARNTLTWGVGGMNIDATRVSGGKGTGNWKGVTDNSAKDLIYAGGWDGSVHGQEPTTADGFVGRWPANTIITHSSGCRLVSENSEIVGGGAKASSGFVNGYENDGFVGKEITNTVWACVEGCPVLNFPQTASTGNGTTTGFRKGGDNEHSVGLAGEKQAADGYADGGSAARYFTQTAYDDEADFPPFIYMAKASKADRNAGLGRLDGREVHRYRAGVGEGKTPDAPAIDKNFHPTVKPVALMQHLIRLVTPAGGKVLDPFLGSGTTAVAAILEGCDWVGCEITPDYWQIIEARVLWAEKKVGENVTLF